jgi:phthiocerol/phenolphthiocerol synthesis type-I polyketide synthase E
MSEQAVRMSEQAVAVVGMACRYPGAADVGQYWAALRAGREGISRFERDDLVAAGADPEYVRRADFVPAKGVMAGSGNFDWSFFGYSRAEAASIDPQQRVFLECASAAVDDAGIDPTRFPGWIGVYAGADVVRAPAVDTLGELAQVIGQEKDFLATRVAYKLGLRGPAITVQTACSTSLTATHMAVRSLLGHECDAALAGGVAVIGKDEWGYLYQAGGILSPDGRCRPFDEQAAGTVPSEGVGVVVLKRLGDALRDGDRIAAVILGSAVNNDGADKVGYTAPSIPGQSDVIRYAQQVGGIDPLDIDYVEAHGTATRMGDPVEVQALTDVFQAATDATGWCWLGAVKSNLGHTGAAAGVAGLIKTVLMIEHRELVPSLHFGRPNPMLDIDSTPFRVCTRARPWPDRGTPLAAVSSFGVGGTNAHVVLQGPPRRARPAARPGPRVLALSAASTDALDRARHDLAERLASSTLPEVSRTPASSTLPEVSRTLASSTLPEVSRTLADRRIYRHRRAYVATEPAEAARLLRDAGEPSPGGSLERVAFLFPGQGTLRHAAGRAPYRLLGGFRGYFDEIRDTVRRAHELDLSPVVTEIGDPDWFTDTVHQQLGLFAVGYALGRQLADWGIRPAAMFGNSIGEYTAATLAGVWAPADAVSLVYQRARAMWATEPGLMATVNAGADEVTGRIGSDGGITIAVAGPGNVVISGRQAAMEALLAGGALRGLDVRPLTARRAFHSATMEPAAAALRAAVASNRGRRPRLRLVSNETGGWADPDAMTEPGYWARQLRRPVLLDGGAATVLGAGCDTFIELGPGTSMIGTLRRHPAWDPGHATVPMLGRSGDDGERGLLRAAGTLWERGADLALADVLAGEQPLRCSLPAHPFTASDPEVAPDSAARPTTEPTPRQESEPVRRLATEPTPRLATEPTPLQASEPARRLAPEPARELARDVRTVAGAGYPVQPVLRQLWCDALGVSSAADTDDFFALGGESLMAVNLVNQIRERTGRTVSVTVFSENATFGRLLRLVEPDQPAAETLPAGVVRLREGGPDKATALFLAADALGTTFGYRALAGLLGEQRPIYGLEPVHHGPPTSIETIAAQHVDAVLEVHGSGPYTIGGWSFGAVVAHEMAHQLDRRGARVDLLICLDGFVPPSRLPIGFDPEILLGSLLLRAGAALGVGPIGHQVRRAPGLRRRLAANLGALLRYRPKRIPSAAVVFKAGADHQTAARLRGRLSPLYGGGVRVHPAGGDHWSMLALPHARDLATRLLEVLPEGANNGR